MYAHSVRGGVGWVVEHKILVTNPEAKFLFSLFGLYGALGFGLGLGLGLVNNYPINYQEPSTKCWPIRSKY